MRRMKLVFGVMLLIQALAVLALAASVFRFPSTSPRERARLERDLEPFRASDPAAMFPRTSCCPVRWDGQAATCRTVKRRATWERLMIRSS